MNQRGHARAEDRCADQCRVDFYSETILSALYLEAQGGGEIILREWKKGVASYRSVIVARADSGITELADLRGGKVAFEDPTSTSGFFFPTTRSPMRA